MKTITLPNGIWKYDLTKKLGPDGGFGTVYSGYSQSNLEVAVKKIKFKGQREIRIADELVNKQNSHVIQIFDAGQDTTTGINFIVMAKAEKSLKDEILTHQIFSDHEATAILLQVIYGLLEIPNLIHRDLKPGNILYHQNAWKIADFGIAKFVEESTSRNTLQGFLSPQYAAPEQWHYLYPTNAVDVYSLGCIAFELLTGNAPFLGTYDELRKHHISDHPPMEKIDNPRLQTILSMMLRKMPETRPTLLRVKELFEQFQVIGDDNSSIEINILSVVASDISERKSIEESERIKAKAEKEHRIKLASEANEILRNLIDELFKKIIKNAPNAILTKHLIPKLDDRKKEIKLGDATLFCMIDIFSYLGKSDFKNSGWDVITGAIITINQPIPNPYIWSANLWYADLSGGTEYRWWEVSYMVNPLIDSHIKYEPFSLTDLLEVDKAASKSMHSIQFGSTPKIIDDEYSNEFITRWIILFAKAASGQLTHPSYLPLD